MLLQIAADDGNGVVFNPFAVSREIIVNDMTHPNAPEEATRIKG